MYYAYLQAGLPQKQLLLGSGNGLRKNRHLCRITENTFGMNLKLTQQPEEAALGAAMYAQRVKEDEQ
jgi:sedoheptulokinase